MDYTGQGCQLTNTQVIVWFKHPLCCPPVTRFFFHPKNRVLGGLLYTYCAIWRHIAVAPCHMAIAQYFYGAIWRMRHMAHTPYGGCAIWRIRHMAHTPYGATAIWRHMAVAPYFDAI